MYRSKITHEKYDNDKTQFHLSQTVLASRAFCNGKEEEMKCTKMRVEGREKGQGRCKRLPLFILCVVERIAVVRTRQFDG